MVKTSFQYHDWVKHRTRENVSFNVHLSTLSSPMKATIDSFFEQWKIGCGAVLIAICEKFQQLYVFQRKQPNLPKRLTTNMHTLDEYDLSGNPIDSSPPNPAQKFFNFQFSCDGRLSCHGNNNVACTLPETHYWAPLLSSEHKNRWSRKVRFICLARSSSVQPPMKCFRTSSPEKKNRKGNTTCS